MNDILTAAARIAGDLHSLGRPFCVIGGVALQRWGEPRMTVDVDATVLVRFGHEAEVIEQLLETFSPRFENALEFGLKNRVVLLRTNDGIGIDISLGAFPFEERAIQRSSEWQIPGHGKVRTCSAEDLLVMKCFAARPQDWIDVEGVIIRQGNLLHHELILAELTPLVELKEEPEILERLGLLFSAHEPDGK
jgi:hypothetical protein